MFYNLVFEKVLYCFCSSILKDSINYYHEIKYNIIKLIAIYYSWIPQRHLTGFSISNCSMDGVTGVYLQLYSDY